MVEFHDLPSLIHDAGPSGAPLAQLSQTPTSKALVGILARRCQFKTNENGAYAAFDLFAAEDEAPSEVRIPSPFAIVCVDQTADSDPQQVALAIRDQLRAADLHTHPVLLIYSGSMAEFSAYFGYMTDLPAVQLNTLDLLQILLSHPPPIAASILPGDVNMLVDEVGRETPEFTPDNRKQHLRGGHSADRHADRQAPLLHLAGGGAEGDSQCAESGGAAVAQPGNSDRCGRHVDPD